MKPRFSLQTIVLLTAIAALSLVVWRQYAELAPLRNEVARLRAEVGVLAISDPDQISVIPLPGPFEPFTWKWRIYLPESRKFLACINADRVPVSGPGKGMKCSSTISGGEYLLTASIREQKPGQWFVSAQWERDADAKTKVRMSGGCSITPTSDWLEKQRGVQTSGVVMAREQRDFAADKPLELLRMRAMTFTPQYPNSTDPNHEFAGKTEMTPGLADGFILWIEADAPPATGASGP